MVNKFTVIKERIREVAKNKGISYEKLYKIIEMTDGSFKGSAIKRPINSDAIVKLYTEFPDIDLHWLITGTPKKEEIHVLNEPESAYGLQSEIKYLKELLKAKDETISILKHQSGLNNGAGKAS